MKYAFLLLVLVWACGPKLPEPLVDCGAAQARTLPDVQRLVVGEWRLVGKGGGHPSFSSPISDSGVRLQITLDSIRVLDRDQPVGTFAWNFAQASTGDITFGGRWSAQRERAYLPDGSGYVAVCESSLTLGTCIIDGVCYSYERVR